MHKEKTTQKERQDEIESVREKEGEKEFLSSKKVNFL